MRNPANRALVYAAVCVGLGWFNAVQVGHWWPWPVFGAAAVVFLLLSLPDSVAPPPTTRADGGEWVEIRLVGPDGEPMSRWHVAEVEAVDDAPTPGHLDVHMTASTLTTATGTVAGYEVRVQGRRLTSGSLPDPVAVEEDAWPVHARYTMHWRGNSPCEDCVPVTTAA